jgi:hypothetical protein
MQYLSVAYRQQTLRLQARRASRALAAGADGTEYCAGVSEGLSNMVVLSPQLAASGDIARDVLIASRRSDVAVLQLMEYLTACTGEVNYNR